MSSFENILPYPERSKLYLLKPLGLNTSMCESLTSYIQRLANAHSITLMTIIKEHIAPLTNKEYLYKDVLRGCSRFFERANAMNGIGEFSKDCSKALERLTKVQDLSILTFQRWEGILTSPSLCDKRKKWCSKCLQEWKLNRSDFYEPLLWSVSIVKCCPIHEILLEHECQSCGKFSSLISNQSITGYCSNCGQYLGIESSICNYLSDQDLWISKSIGELIANTEMNTNNNVKLKSSFEQLSNLLTNGNIESLGKILNLPKSTIYQYHTGKYLPLLDTILKICWLIQVRPIDFLLGHPFTCSLNFPSRMKNDSKIFKKKNWFGIEQQLKSMLSIHPPLSLNSVTRLVHVSSKTIKKKFPSLAEEIKNKYSNYIHERTLQRRKTLVNTIYQVNLTLFDEGIVPTVRLVEKAMSKPGVLRNKVLLNAWKESKEKIIREHHINAESIAASQNKL